ncbi:MAG: hypothetical protein ACYDG6_03665 [Thermincolia bacterium]
MSGLIPTLAGVGLSCDHRPHCEQIVIALINAGTENPTSSWWVQEQQPG